MVDIIYRNQEFLVEESCGKCFPCRRVLGTSPEFWANSPGVRVLKRIEGHRRTLKDDDAGILVRTGQFAPTTITDGLQYFKTDFEKRIKAA